MERPTRIMTILDTIRAEDGANLSAELDAYIADLEAKQPQRPTRIAAILTIIDSQYPVNVRTSLEAYVSDLEARQQTTPHSNGDFAPSSSTLYWRGVERQLRRRLRTLRKQNNYR